MKAAGRTRSNLLKPLITGTFSKSKNCGSVSVIGCGQAAFSILCYFLYRQHPISFLMAYDPDVKQAQSLARFYEFRGVAPSANYLLQDPELEIVYVASNHASHADYAVTALEKGKKVFVEKPVAVSWAGLHRLEAAVDGKEDRIWAGYNRPFSAAIRTLRMRIAGTNSPLTLMCYVHGHLITQDHWYRKEEEGTRICGNAGHWLDLAVHLLAAVHGSLPGHIYIQHLPADPAEPDDNFSLTLRTPLNDLITLHFASRSEPAEGVREMIEVQCADLSAQIDDFRQLHIWEKDRTDRHRYSPKDVGHARCTAQPFLPKHDQRSWNEVMCSTRLMLHIADMVREGRETASVDLTSDNSASSFDVG